MSGITNEKGYEIGISRPGIGHECVRGFATFDAARGAARKAAIVPGVAQVELVDGDTGEVLRIYAKGPDRVPGSGRSGIHDDSGVCE